MSDKTPSESAREDLAFIKALVAPDDNWQQHFGTLYFAAGLCYSVQIVLQAGQKLGFVSGSSIVSQLIGWGPSVAFIGFLIWFIRRHGGRPIGSTSRAVTAVFGAVGLSNLILCVSIGSISLRLHSQTIWLIYPVVVMILQGMAWTVASMLRRKVWLGLVAMGWFGVGLAMAICIDNIEAYVIAVALGIVCFMTAPGYYLMRQPRPASPVNKALGA